jgi:septal ring factor EnvC (AmiA/AmiB activator)
MTSVRRTIPRPMAAAVAALLVTLGLAAIPVSSPAAPSLGQLKSQLNAEQGHQQSLANSIASLSHLIASLTGQIALVESREAAVKADLVRDRARLAAVQRALTRERHLLAQLRARLAQARMLLARQLVTNYEQSKPDLVSVVLESNGFKDLLDRLSFLRDAQQQQQAIITITERAKARADAAARHLSALQASDRQITYATALRVRALAGMNVLLHSKQAALQQARTAKSNALSASRARGSHLASEIAHIEAEQAAAARAAAAQSAANSAGSSAPTTSAGSGAAPTPVGPTYGASGGWAIPYAIVLCESGGQNLTPNGAGASGYYQILPSTWKLFGGTGPAAYLASKAEQDAVASRIWNGGGGASNWVCAGIVGIH